MIEVGAGSGSITCAFLDAHPRLRAVLADIPEVIGHTREMVERKGKADRVEFRAVNILEPWPFGKGRFSLVVLSNIIHAYSEKELPHILAEAAACMNERGMLVVHDFFFDHYPEKAALFDLNMLINTYNGRVFSSASVREGLEGLALRTTGLIPLISDTGLIVASREQDVLDALSGRLEGLSHGQDKGARLQERPARAHRGDRGARMDPVEMRIRMRPLRFAGLPAECA